MNVSDCDLAPTAATTQYYYLTVADATMTVSKAKLWGYSGSDTVLFGLYRGYKARLNWRISYITIAGFLLLRARGFRP